MMENKRIEAALPPALAGRSSAWELLATQVRPALNRRARHQLPGALAQRLDGSDIVQDTLAEAWKSIRQFTGRSAPELMAWLYGILDHNLADQVRRHLRSAKRSVSHEATGALSRGSGPYLGRGDRPSSAARRAEAAEQLLASLEALPERQRAALRLKHLEGHSLAETARRLDCSVAAAAGLLARGMRTLRAAHRAHAPDSHQ